jgi:hypothetical protein
MMCDVLLHDTVNIEWCTTMLRQIIYVAGNNKTYLSLHVKYQIFLPDFNQI